jgi:hypothetical protein
MSILTDPKAPRDYSWTLKPDRDIGHYRSCATASTARYVGDEHGEARIAQYWRGKRQVKTGRAHRMPFSRTVPAIRSCCPIRRRHRWIR